MSQKRIELYYDVTSPFTWFAFEVLMRYKKHWDVVIELKPFLLMEIGKAAANTSPGFNPTKRKYLSEDIPRLARYFDVPLKMISNPMKSMFERGSVAPTRFLTAIDIYYPEFLENVTRALWMELWNKDEDITTPEVLVRAGKTGGLTGEQVQKLQQHMTEQVVIDKLKSNNDMAFKYGGFGSPLLVVHGVGKPMLFFGSDRFPVLANEAGLKWVGPNPDAHEPRL